MSEDEKKKTGQRRCGEIGEDEDDVVTIKDVISEYERLEADADAVLGGSDPNNCTYPQGYVKRQAVFACMTCTPGGNAGMCLACSLTCHDGHDLLELYTKRNFSCDCGNEKFGDFKCKLNAGERSLNSRNRYSQNFNGLYCTCARPYPDLENPVADEMIQCIICEDWYHGRHLKTTIPDSDDYHEMICSGCMCRHSFLWAYHIISRVVTVKNETSHENINVERPTVNTDEENKENDKASCESENTAEKNEISPSGLKRSAEESDGPETKKLKLNNNQEEPSASTEECYLNQLQKREVEEPESAAFWVEGWRQKLCRCSKCMDLYKDKDIEFLLDDHDTVQAYEEKGRVSSNNRESHDDSEASMLAGLDRVQQIELARGYYNLKTELTSFLNGFAQEGKVVTAEDMREFFEKLKEKQRNDTFDIPPPNCR